MTPIVNSNPTAADAMPPKMYHIVWCVRRPRNTVLRLSAKERDATAPMMIRTIPATSRTTPKIRVMLIMQKVLVMPDPDQSRKSLVAEGKFLTACIALIFINPGRIRGRWAFTDELWPCGRNENAANLLLLLGADKIPCEP